MSTDHEALIRDEMNLNRAREEAALREHSTWVKALSIVRILGWLCAFIPVIGMIGAVFLAFIVPFVGNLVLAAMGAKKHAIRQILITIGGFAAAFIVWAIVNLVVLAAFA